MKTKGFRIVIALLLLLATVLGSSSCAQKGGEATATAPGGISSPMTLPQSGEKLTELEDPHPVSTANVAVVGDILIHSTVYQSADRGNGVYDFTETYGNITPYLSKYDYTVANLEVTLGGPNPVVGTYPSAYPSFNCPDSIVDALKGAGVDMLLTANNHSYDTRKAGLIRTVQVLKEKGLDYLGTRETTSENLLCVKEINGIKIGMACYTYSTKDGSGNKYLNGIRMSADAFDLVSSFTYNDLNGYYEQARRDIEEMRAQGAQFIMFYVHWGNEYQYAPNSYQKRIAQKLSDLGVDVIVGGHPHVIQPFETLTGANGNQTLCIYSTGNFISNQRKELMDSDNYSGHTEDGMIFSVQFEKWSDGTYRLSQVNIEPTWVIRERRNGRLIYDIIPLDLTVSDWKTFNLTDSTVAQAKASYNRTMKLVGEGINAARAKLNLPLLANSVS